MSEWTNYSAVRRMSHSHHQLTDRCCMRLMGLTAIKMLTTFQLTPYQSVSRQRSHNYISVLAISLWSGTYRIICYHTWNPKSRAFL